MDGDTRLTLTLALNVSIDSIYGQLSGADGEARPFVGWLGLAEAIEGAIRSAYDEHRAGPPA
jgi:hypothetical protein